MTLWLSNGREVCSGSTLQLSTVLRQKAVGKSDFSCLGFWPFLPLCVSSSPESIHHVLDELLCVPFTHSSPKSDPVEPQAGTEESQEESSPNLFPPLSFYRPPLDWFTRSINFFQVQFSVSLEGVQASSRYRTLICSRGVIRRPIEFCA